MNPRIRLTSAKIEVGVEVEAELGNWSFRSHFVSEEFSYTGKDTKQPLDRPGFVVYKIQIKGNIDSEEDSEANFKNYKDIGEGSYRQCVKTAVEEKFLSVYGCMPPWFTDDVHQVCDQGLSKQEWKIISEDVFPTMQQTFRKVKQMKSRAESGHTWVPSSIVKLQT